MATQRSVRRHQDLKVWQMSIRLVKEIYAITATFPKDETYGLMSQMRRAAISIPSNIAEGAARTGTREFIQFIGIARGSLSELETQLHIARELGFIDRPMAADATIEELFLMLASLATSLRNR